MSGEIEGLDEIWRNIYDMNEQCITWAEIKKEWW